MVEIVETIYGQLRMINLMSLPSSSSQQLLGEELGNVRRTVMPPKSKNNVWISGRLNFFAQFLLLSIATTVASSAPASSPQSADVVLVPSSNTPLKTCAQIFGNSVKSEEEKMLMCQLYESSALLAQLGALVNQGLDRLIVGQTEASGQLENPDQNWDGVPEGQREKKKHEYLRFGKRKHEYLRFGKRKHEYLRFG